MEILLLLYCRKLYSHGMWHFNFSANPFSKLSYIHTQADVTRYFNKLYWLPNYAVSDIAKNNFWVREKFENSSKIHVYAFIRERSNTMSIIPTWDLHWNNENRFPPSKSSSFLTSRDGKLKSPLSLCHTPIKTVKWTKGNRIFVVICFN